MRSLVDGLIEDVRAACLEDRSGDIFHGTPVLEEVDPESFGICLATAELGEGDAELRAAVLELFIFAIHDNVDRSVRALATGRVTPTTSS